MSARSYQSLSEVLKVVSNQIILWATSDIEPTSPGETDLLARIRRQIQLQEAGSHMPFVGKEEQVSGGGKLSRELTLRAIFPDVTVNNLSKVDRRKGPKGNGRQLYGIFNGDFRVGSYIMKLKLLDVEVDAEETVQDVNADGGVMVLRLLAGYYVIGAEAIPTRTGLQNDLQLRGVAGQPVPIASDHYNGESPRDPWDEVDLMLHNAQHGHGNGRT